MLDFIVWAHFCADDYADGGWVTAYAYKGTRGVITYTVLSIAKLSGQL